MYLNKTIIIGNLTRDPELKSLPSGVQVTNIGVATNRNWKDKEGNKQEQVEYHNVVIFGKQAETTAQYLKKGSQALIEGRLQTRSWESDGVKKYRTEIIAESVQFGVKKESTETTPEKVGLTDDEVKDMTSDDINPEDVPF